MKIIGAGLAGLIAANVFPQARIIEAQGREKLDRTAFLL
jgi:predicted NAD/FAD-dependent oxidoreductase